MIYAIQPENEPAVKIGYTTGSLQKRLTWLQVGNHKRLELLGAIPGDWKTEQGLHKTLAPCRIRGEWFRLETPVLEFLQTMPRVHGLRARGGQLGAPTKMTPAKSYCAVHAPAYQVDSCDCV